MSDEGWVTDPKVIDTIVALGEIRDGDEIKFTKRPAPDGWIGFSEGQVCVVGHTTGPTYTFTFGETSIPGVHVDHYYFCRSNSAAWRRPNAKT